MSFASSDIAASEASSSARSDAKRPHAFNSPNVPVPPPTYSQLSITPLLPTSRLITLAGQVGLDAKTGKVVEGFDAQVKLAYQNILECLRAAAATPRDIIHVKHLIVKDTGRVSHISSNEQPHE